MVLKNYLFSYISGNYQQYTSDYTESFIKPYCINCKTTHQIAVHRDGNLMHYTYLYKNNNFVYGISLVCGEVCLNLKWLYNYLQGVIEDAAYKGVLFYYNEQGIICKNIDNWNQETAEIDRIFRNIKEYINKQQSYWDILPPEDFSIPKDSKIVLSFNEDDKEKITDAIRHYNNVIVTLENINQSGFGRIVENLNAEKKKLQEEKAILETEIDSLTKQKKQYRWVAILSICVIASLIGLYFLNDNLSDIISNQNNTISLLESAIANKNSEITSLCDTLSQERGVIKQKNNEIRLLNTSLITYKDSLRLSLERNDELTDKLSEQESRFYSIKNTFPINITNIEIGNTYHDGSIETKYGSTLYSSNTMYLKPRITYTGINTGSSIKLKIKWYTPNGTLSTGEKSPSGFSQEASLYVYSGSNTKTLSGWGNKTKGYWSSGTYRIEVWYNDVCIKSKTFRIY